MAKLLHRFDRAGVANARAELGQLIDDAHNSGIADTTSVVGNNTDYHGIALGAWRCSFVCVFDLLRLDDVLGRVGLGDSFNDAGLQVFTPERGVCQLGDRMAGRLWKCACCVRCERGIRLMILRVCLYVLAPMASDQADERQVALQCIKLSWESYVSVRSSSGFSALHPVGRWGILNGRGMAGTARSIRSMFELPNADAKTRACHYLGGGDHNTSFEYHN